MGNADNILSNEDKNLLKKARKELKQGKTIKLAILEKETKRQFL